MSVIEAIALEPVDALTVTTLVDNVTDSLLADQGPAKRPSIAAAPRVPARLLVGGNTDDALRAEHGFSALVTVVRGGRETRVLFDAGRLRVSPRRGAAAAAVEEFSDRELAVLRLLSSELSQREIGGALYISFNTVKTHSKNIYRKLGVSQRADAVTRARELALL